MTNARRGTNEYGSCLFTLSKRFDVFNRRPKTRLVSCDFIGFSSMKLWPLCSIAVTMRTILDYEHAHANEKTMR